MSRMCMKFAVFHYIYITVLSEIFFESLRQLFYFYVGFFHRSSGRYITYMPAVTVEV